MSRLREEQKAAMSRLREEQKAAMSRLREEQKAACRAGGVKPDGTLVSCEALQTASPATTRKTRAFMDQLIFFLPLLIIMGAFLFFASRRQKRAMQATIDLHESLRVGDRVHTTSGLQATIAGIDDDTVDLEIAPGVITTWMKLAIRDRVEPDIDDDDDDEASPELTDSDAVDETGRLTKD